MTTQTIKPIETHYAGCRFRSRLEARWAVFFDTLGIKWEYEAQGYNLNGVAYLPDFWLSEYQTWVEVKDSRQDNFEGEHVDLLRMLANATGHPAILLIGQPEPRMYHRFVPDVPKNKMQAVFFDDSLQDHIQIADAYWFQAAEFRSDDGAFVFDMDERACKNSFGRGFVAAMNAARSARFEFGETPIPKRLRQRAARG